MKVLSITSETNSTLKLIRALHRRQAREKEKLFLLEGTHCLIEAFKKNLELESIVVNKSFLNQGIEEISQFDIAQLSVLDDALFKDLVSTSSSCGVLAIAHMPRQDRSSFSNWSPLQVLLADSIQDPGNLGTLMRTAYAAGFGGMLLLKGSVDLFNPKVVRAAAGALFELPVLSDVELSDAVELIEKAGMSLVLCDARAQTAYYEADLSGSIAIALGNEGRGISPDLMAITHKSVSIPMNPGAESLNVAVSGGIILFEAARQRALAKK